MLSKKILHPKLSYKIVGVLFDVYNELGYGLKEKYYQRAIAIAFKKNRMVFKEQVSIPLEFQDTNIGRYFLDFLVEDKIVVEIKRGDHFSMNHIEQIFSYLQATNLELGILANFTSNGVKYKRIINIE